MQRIILDTDLALGSGSDVDDGFALALAHADPDIGIDLITTVNGNTDVDTATRLTHTLLRELGVADVPVVRGASRPLDGIRKECPYDLARHDGASLSAEREDPPRDDRAAHAIVSHVLEYPGEITVVAIGPLTNVALALALEPRLAEHVREIVIMGGVFLSQTFETGMPGEFNVWSDPDAAQAVLDSGASTRWVGLDVTRKVRLTMDQANLLAASGSGFGRIAGAAAAKWIRHLGSRHPGDPQAGLSCAMHDPLAVAAVSHPELVTWVPAHVGVVTDDGIARGITVTDLLHSTDAPSPNCRIASGVDAAAFLEHFTRSILSLD